MLQGGHFLRIAGEAEIHPISITQTGILNLNNQELAYVGLDIRPLTIAGKTAITKLGERGQEAQDGSSMGNSFIEVSPDLGLTITGLSMSALSTYGVFIGSLRVSAGPAAGLAKDADSSTETLGFKTGIEGILGIHLGMGNIIDLKAKYTSTTIF